MTGKIPKSDLFLPLDRFLNIFVICCLILIVGGIMAPLSQPRIPMNHMRAAQSSRELITAEHEYSTRFPASGFTCDLHQLEEAGMVDKVLGSGLQAGYHYELLGCNTTAPVSHFTLSALPTIQGKSGKFAFCANQQGVLWFAADGSADSCFKVRNKYPL